MPSWKTRTLAGIALALPVVCLPWQAGQAYLLPQERPALDLPYEVNEPDASYFDVAARMQLLAQTDDTMMRRVYIGRASGGARACQDVLITVVTGSLKEKKE